MKNLTTGKISILSKEKTDNPKLCTKKLSDGRLSLYLNYYFGYDKEYDEENDKGSIKVKRQKVSLDLYMYENPRTPEERQHNKDVIELARKIRFEREQSLLQAKEGYRLPQKEDVEFLEFFRNYIDSYTKKDIKMVKLAYDRFVDFLTDTPKYKALAKRIKPGQIDRDMIREYTDYLQTRSVGSGAQTIYSRFKKVVKYAVEHNVFAKNPCEGISIKVDKNTLTKAILSLDEIQTLINTPFVGNPNIRRAFLFSLYTGMRWCDVRELKFENVDFSNKMLSFTQKKTEGSSSHAGVTVPLSDGTLSLVGEKGELNSKVFQLPSYELCCRYIRKWVRAAGINKQISWHCARHSFAVNVLNSGANIKTVSSLLGHSSISMTEKYLHVVDSLKRQAVESLPDLLK